ATGFGPAHSGYDLDTRIASKPNTSYVSMSVQGDGKVVVAGTLLDPNGNALDGFGELRVTADGLADTTFGTDGLASQFVGHAAGANAAALPRHRKTLVTGGYGGQCGTTRLGGDAAAAAATPSLSTSSSPDTAAPAGSLDALALGLRLDNGPRVAAYRPISR